MKTMVFGYSDSPDRYSYMAHELLKSYGHESLPINPRHEEELKDLASDIHTLTLYVNPTVSAKFQDLLVGLHPKRVIFNPGTESPELQKKFEKAGSEVVVGCTLVMLRTGQF